MDNLSQETDALTDWRDDLKTNFLHNAPELQDGKKKKRKSKHTNAFSVTVFMTIKPLIVVLNVKRFLLRFNM